MSAWRCVRARPAPRGGRPRTNVVTGSRGWGDFDKEGDDDQGRERPASRRASSTSEIDRHRHDPASAVSGVLHARRQSDAGAAGGRQRGDPGLSRRQRRRRPELRPGHAAGRHRVSYPPPNKVARGYVPELTKLVGQSKVAAPTDAELLIRLLRNEPGAHGGLDGQGPHAASGRQAALRAAAPSGDGRRSGAR